MIPYYRNPNGRSARLNTSAHCSTQTSQATELEAKLGETQSSLVSVAAKCCNTSTTGYEAASVSTTTEVGHEAASVSTATDVCCIGDPQLCTTATGEVGRDTALSISISSTETTLGEFHDHMFSPRTTCVATRSRSVSPSSRAMLASPTHGRISPLARIVNAASVREAVEGECAERSVVQSQPESYYTWPGVLVTPGASVVRSMEHPAHWVYFTRGQLIRYFVDKKNISRIRTLTVVGDHTLMLGHLGIRLAERDQEDEDEIILASALETDAPLFLLPHAMFGHLAAQVVFCDNVRGELTPERCATFEQSTSSVWAMCGVPSAVRDAATSDLLTLTEYAKLALGVKPISAYPCAINAEDRRDLIHMLQAVPALRINNELISAEAFAYFLNYDGPNALVDVHREFKMRKVAKCRRQALDCPDPVSALCLFDSAMGQSAEDIAYRCELLSAALERTEDMYNEPRGEERKRAVQRILAQTHSTDDTRNGVDPCTELRAELARTQQELEKWKSFADKCEVQDVAIELPYSPKHDTAHGDITRVPLEAALYAGRREVGEKSQACCVIS